MAQALTSERRQDLRNVLLERELNRRKKTVVGLVNGDGDLSHSIVKLNGNWSTTEDTPDIYLPDQIEPVVISQKRFIVLYGGRGSAKSVSVADICVVKAKDEGAKTYCLREYQSSIRNSVHALLKAEIARFNFGDFDVQQNSIEYRGDPVFQFAGLARNVDSVKSAHGFTRYWIEEAQFLSADSLEALTPTARNMPKPGLPGDVADILDFNAVSMIFVANLASVQDPFSQRFIVPFQDELDRHGIYEDELHLIINMNYVDNPWYADSGLEEERAFDHEHKPRAVSDHVWMGAYNDDVANAIIPAEWFDACIDAHLKIKGWEPKGIRVTSHDPSDMGDDPKAVASRHGTVVTFADEIPIDDVNDGCDAATDHAIERDADYFVYDADGLGVTLRRQVNHSLLGKKIKVVAYKGSEGVEKPEAIYQGKDEFTDETMKPRTNKQTFKNMRAQKYWNLRDRCYLTYRTIVHGDYNDPDNMISLSSDIPNMSKLRSEMCRIPRKPNGAGLIQIMTKDEMRKLHIPSPNLSDSVKMLWGFEPTIKPEPAPKMTFARAV